MKKGAIHYRTAPYFLALLKFLSVSSDYQYRS